METPEISARHLREFGIEFHLEAACSPNKANLVKLFYAYNGNAFLAGTNYKNILSNTMESDPHYRGERISEDAIVAEVIRTKDDFMSDLCAFTKESVESGTLKQEQVRRVLRGNF